MTLPAHLTDRALVLQIDALNDAKRALAQEIVSAQNEFTQAESKYHRLNKLKAIIESNLEDLNQEKNSRG